MPNEWLEPLIQTSLGKSSVASIALAAVSDPLPGQSRARIALGAARAGKARRGGGRVRRKFSSAAFDVARDRF